ncbi:hypothetical protein BLNAU_6209 [Blattamonas nauphoetae]|uniref:Uncharacterized protein n=1 Tax=Blattamonas nauphoetae TaxID=2049346 RepID=A0ABQ9Y4M8_9EUKA|nr:hypothetical protein BLNAU_6209 [Blattamonas nauphoetae]
MNHAIRFIEYAGMHIKHRKVPHNLFFDLIYRDETDQHTNLLSSLINLLSLPSDALRTAVLCFLYFGLHYSCSDFNCAIVATGLLPKLFLVLKPHEIPLNGTTSEFHRHLTSIVDHFFSFVLFEDIRSHLGDTSRAAEITEPMLASFCSYLQYLIDMPACPPDHRSGFTLLWNMTLFHSSDFKKHCQSSSPTIKQFFGQIRRKMMNELDLLFGHASARNVENLVKFGRIEESNILSWVTAFESLLGRVREGKKISDFAVSIVTDFLYCFPNPLKIFFSSDDTFCLTMNSKMVSSSKMDSHALWTLFTPSQPHHAADTLAAFSRFVKQFDNVTCWQFVWKGWFPRFRNAVDPSKLPFTFEFRRSHTTLINLLDDHLKKLRDYESEMTRMNDLTDELRSELDELHLAFYKQTKEYIVHLSLHPFALDDQFRDTILDFLSRLFGSDCEHSKTRSFREEVRRDMDASSLSSSPPPFILTSELASPFSDHLILNIVDRLVVLLESDSCLDDDTILRISAFIRKVHSRVYLPDVFRTAGRSTEQYFHTLESLLAFYVNCSPQYSIEYLLSTRPAEHEPTLDEWDDVDLETGLSLMRVINQNTLSRTSDSPQPNKLLINHVIQCLPQARHCAARHPQPQLERLISPSIDILCTHFIQPRLSEMREAQRREKAFVGILKLCDERVIARCVNKTGFFSRLVADLLNPDFAASKTLFCLIVDRGFWTSIRPDDQKAIRKTAHHFLEEGWQDALETVFVKKGFIAHDTKDSTSRMMQFFGTN